MQRSFHLYLYIAQLDTVVNKGTLILLKIFEENLASFLAGSLVTLLTLVHYFHLMERLDTLNDTLREAVKVLGDLSKQKEFQQQIIKFKGSGNNPVDPNES
jgi:hypothetical protein